MSDQKYHLAQHSISSEDAGNGAPFVLLPTSQVRLATFDLARSEKTVQVPPELSKKLTEVAGSLNATFFMATCAAFFALLHRYSGLHHIVVGIPAAHHLLVHHSHTEIPKLFGYLLNEFALQVRITSSSTFRDVVSSVRGALFEGNRSPGLSVERNSINPDVRCETHPVYKITFECEPTSALTLKLLELPQGKIDAQTQPTPPDLSFALVERDHHWHATLRYPPALYDAGTIDRFMEHYLQLLEGCVSAPAAPIGFVNMLTEPERAQILSEWNRTERDYPHDHCIHELFEAHVRCSPQRVAAVAGLQTITYLELDRRAGRLAEVLRSKGVGPDILVGLCLDRSLDLLVGVLGILKAGGAYVPIDPAYPKDRIAFVLEDSATRVIVTQRSLLSALGTSSADRVLIDELPVPDLSHVSPSRPVGSHHLAYVLYTSGSTGKPKGVQISHRSVINFLHSMRRKPGLTSHDVLLAVTTLSFDIAGLELHLPLTTGATVILAPWEVAADGQALLREIERYQVTVLQATPATWKLMINAGWKGTPRLKALCGGEALPASLAAELLPRCAELWNMYGPTETTIWSTCCQVTDATDIHIGRPIDNTEVYILDTNQQPLPVGHAGELLIGGDGLARGYLNRTELTTDRFIAHPFKTGQRLYRTGDLARYREDGNIDCLGRLDFQVKIRGFRIELGEIENHLASHPVVKEAVVIAREDTPGEKRLVAYFVPRSNEPVTADQLREHLKKKLPDHMIPAAFVTLTNLPLTPNGKVDRKGLPAPILEVARLLPPTCTPTETRLVMIFEKILGLPVASAHDSFFDLGGHSLMAAGLMIAIEREFDRRLPLARLFDSPTIAGLAAILDLPATEETHWDSLVPIQRQEGKPVLFLVHGAGGNVLLYRELSAALGSDISVYGFQSQGLDGRAVPLARVEEMATRYVTELRAFQPHGPYHIGGYCMGGSVAYEMARLLQEQGQLVGLVALLDTYNFSLVKQKNALSFLRQKIQFHLENLATMKPRNLLGYIGEKTRMAREVLIGKMGSQVASLKKRTINGAYHDFGVTTFIQEINDQAAINFLPRPLAGRLTVFRPQKQYDFMSDPKMGWSGLVSGQLDVVQLPVNPHAMLIDPYATVLAQELKSRLIDHEKRTRESSPSIPI